MLRATAYPVHWKPAPTQKGRDNGLAGMKSTDTEWKP